MSWTTAAKRRARTAGIVVMSGFSTIACGSPPETEPDQRYFTPEESAAPAVNRIVMAEAPDTDLAEDEIALAIQAESIERLFGGHFAVLYDPDRVAVVAAEPGDLFESGFFVTSLEQEEPPVGQLMVGFAQGSPPESASAVNGTIAVITVRTLEKGSSEVGYQIPPFWWESRERALVAADGAAIAGTRWLGGIITWE